jgi:hypothetical protein
MEEGLMSKVTHWETNCQTCETTGPTSATHVSYISNVSGGESVRRAKGLGHWEEAETGRRVRRGEILKKCRIREFVDVSKEI